MASFGEALKALKAGGQVIREGWNENSKMTLPYLYIEYPEGHPAYPKGCRVPWLPSQTDLDAEDWFMIIEERD